MSDLRIVGQNVHWYSGRVGTDFFGLDLSSTVVF